MHPESQDQLNLEINQILLDILPHTEEALQLEIAQIIQQIHRINHLIYRQQNHWLSGIFKSPPKEQELLSWLTEVKAILLMLKSEQSSLSMVQILRINLERNINNYQYYLGGWLLNICLYLTRSKSTPLKIVSGLLLTTILSIIMLKISIVDLYQHDPVVSTSHALENPFTSTDTYFTHPLVMVNHSVLIQQIKPKTSITHSEQMIFHRLLYAASAGALGSIASLLFRVTRFNNESYDDPLIPFFLGIFKPFIGLILGIFVCSLITSETIIRTDFITSSPVSDTTGITSNARRHSFIFSLAFLIGFSERLASDLLKSTEAKIDPESEKAKES